MIVLRVLAIVVGAIMVLRTLFSAVRTVVVPRAEYAWLTRVHFVLWRKVFGRLAPLSRPFVVRDHLMAFYAPIGLVTLPAIWLFFIITGFAGVFWGFGVEPIGEAFVLSGSSVTTLGFARPDQRWLTAVAVTEAGIGLGIVALLISYLPTIYGAFSRREALVGMLEVRAGLPPSPMELFTRYTRIGRLDQLGDDVFGPWESWFADIEESHTTQPSLLFFRSPHPERSWITAAGCVLDTAALRSALIDLPREARADVMLRTGYLSLRRIADYFQIEYDHDPRPGDPISISRREFDNAVTELRATGVPLKADLDRAWADFAGWRVNYDRVLTQLATLVMAPPGRWSSDRPGQEQLSPSLRMPAIERARAAARRRR